MAEPGSSPLASPSSEADMERAKLVPELSEEIAKLDEEMDRVGRPDPCIDASSFSTKELNYHMEIRGLKASGFWADDISNIQVHFDQEYEERVAEKEAIKAEIRKKREKKIQQARERLQSVRERDEEKRAVSKSLEARFWMKIFDEYPEDAPRHVRMNVDPPLARVVAQMLDGTIMSTPLISLDLSNSNVGDRSGARLAQALIENTTLVKLELEGTDVGPLTAEAFGHALPKNNTLKYLSLEANYLLDEDGDSFGLKTLFEGISQNNTLQHLSIWDCKLDKRAGDVIVDGLEKESNSFTTLCYGCNSFTIVQESLISQRMDRNKKLNEMQMEHDARHRAEELRFEQIRANEEAKKVAMQEEEEWLERRKVERANERQRKKDEEEAKRIAEEEAKREEELARQRKLEEDKARAEAKRKKKKKKKR